MMGSDSSAMLIIEIHMHSAPELVKKLKSNPEKIKVPVFSIMKIDCAYEKVEPRTVTMDANPEATFISLDAANNHAKGLLDKWTKELKGSKAEVIYEQGHLSTVFLGPGGEPKAILFVRPHERGGLFGRKEWLRKNT